MEILNGKLVAEEIKSAAKARAENLKNKPLLACIIVEGDKASEIYVASKEKACNEYGLLSKIIRLKNDISQDLLEAEIERLNKNKEVTGILLQLPLPKHLNSQSALSKIAPEKDVDCLTALNLGKLFAGQSKFAPCTATGVIKLLERYNISIEGKRAVVVGRSLLVGKSVATLLEQKNATVTLCHSKTQNLKEVTKQADILIVAVGKSKFITKEFVKDGAVVVDVGINREDGKIRGDVDFEDVKDKCSYITPVPGGVGPLTIACLLDNTVILAEQAENNRL